MIIGASSRRGYSYSEKDAFFFEEDENVCLLVFWRIVLLLLRRDDILFLIWSHLISIL